MLKHLSSSEITAEHLSAVIKERNIYIKANKYSVIGGGIANFGDMYIVGEAHADAAKWLDKKLSNATTTETAIGYEKECEEIFDVQVWASYDFDIAEIKG